ncbi:uncharacterized protein LOC106881968 isoform X1 [Octopus bimaculoides]|uniref:uncharacterized protein LOC106881968 isoform X1 n=1 Tax=Octopus bimaculoides TaxID=37653 RepID=UPI0022E6721F|nr:uncharacterized protein LOC106881968 isoform X1 [Octopus bimaculoides]
MVQPFTKPLPKTQEKTVAYRETNEPLNRISRAHFKIHVLKRTKQTLPNIRYAKMDVGLFSEFRKPYTNDISDVTTEMADTKSIINLAVTPIISPTATPTKRKEGEVSEFVQPLRKHQMGVYRQECTEMCKI